MRPLGVRAPRRLAGKVQSGVIPVRKEENRSQMIQSEPNLLPVREAGENVFTAFSLEKKLWCENTRKSGEAASEILN